MREKYRSLFDLLLDESSPWETLHEEHKNLAIDILARLIAKAARDSEEKERVMNDSSKVKPSHTRRAAFVYIRQSSPAQVENNRESTARQYALVDKPASWDGPRNR